MREIGDGLLQVASGTVVELGDVDVQHVIAIAMLVEAGVSGNVEPANSAAPSTVRS